MNPKRAHISFDDVFASLRWLSRNNPLSIFDMCFFGSLRRLHREYGAVFSLYAFHRDESFAIDMLPDKYRQEFYDAAEWLRFGFHADMRGQNVLRLDPDGFDAALTRFNESIRALTPVESVCGRVRLHNWAATDKQVAVMKSLGIRTLLCRDNEGDSYDLTSEESAVLAKCGFLERNGLKYRRTDIRYDDCPDTGVSLAPLFERAADEIVLFGHERHFADSLERIERSIQLLCRNGYTFFAE